MSDRISLFDWLAQVQIRLTVWRRGRRVGTDTFGNVYYLEKQARRGMKARRWVLYKGAAEASKVPPEWFGWLHYMMDAPLPSDSQHHRPWVQPHRPNPTGTVNAYRPPGHPLSGGQRDAATGDYQSWQPN